MKAVEDDIGATILPGPDNSKLMTTLVHKVIILLEKPTFVGVYVDSFQYIYSSYKKIKCELCTTCMLCFCYVAEHRSGLSCYITLYFKYLLIKQA